VRKYTGSVRRSLAAKAKPGVSTSLHPEMAELVDRGRRAIAETLRLGEEQRFIFEWIRTPRAPGVRVTSLLLEVDD
jgi:hypothetical protein